MSSIVREASGSWRARYRDPDGRQHSRCFRRRVDAEQLLTSVDHAKLSGAYVDPAAGRVRFRTYAKQWRAIQVHRPSTVAQVETNLRRHVYPYLGDRPLASETLETYSHLWPDAEDRTRAAVDDVLGAAMESRRAAADSSSSRLR